MNEKPVIALTKPDRETMETAASFLDSGKFKAASTREGHEGSIRGPFLDLIEAAQKSGITVGTRTAGYRADINGVAVHYPSGYGLEHAREDRDTGNKIEAPDKKNSQPPMLPPNLGKGR